MRRGSKRERGEAISEAEVIHETRTSFLKPFTWIPSFLPHILRRNQETSCLPADKVVVWCLIVDQEKSNEWVT